MIQQTARMRSVFIESLWRVGKLYRNEYTGTAVYYIGINIACFITYKTLWG